nr:PREDICTED: uncharacterized protein LOC109030051 isoform X1 [Bemisia tabaci]XP_018896351.1 PREDICTED: uncharacterized protein LOC109030051 isoform X1 [Bemisia tabaci]
MFYLFICFHLSLFLDCFQVNPRMGRHAHAITLIRSAIGQRSTTPPNYVLSAALHAGGSVEQAIQILESYADIVSPRQDSPLACIVAVVIKIIIGGINFSVIDKHFNASGEDKLGPWACRTAHRNNCSTTSTATSTATSTSSTCIDSSTEAIMSGRNNNQFRRGAAIRRHIEN